MIHYSFVGYMIATAIILIVCVGAYRILLESKTRPSANRIILLLIYGLAFILPLVSALIPEYQNGIKIEVGNLELAGDISEIYTKHDRYNFDMPMVLSWVSRIYFTGFFITILLSFVSLAQLLFLLKKSKKTKIAGVDVYVHDNKKLSSFSWYNRIFLYKESLNSEVTGIQMLVAHEKAHLDMGHWRDLLLAQIIIVFQWFNPAAWFIRRELQRVHEYEADRAVLNSGAKEKDYQMLLIQNISGNRYSGLTDGLNNSSLKKRIIMMKKTKFKKDWVPRVIAVCGFAILGGFIVHIPAVATVLENSSQSTESPEKMIVTKNIQPENTTEADIKYYIDGEKTGKENLASLDPSNIKAMTIDKSTENPKVEVNTKNSFDLEDLSNRDFSEFKKKGLVENYPDAYGVVDKIAEYEGGQSQLLKDLIESMEYPEEAIEKDIQGKVVVRFQINTNGTLSNCEVAYSQNPMLDAAAIKAVEGLPGKWQPAEVDGQPVASVFNMPVSFKLR